ncbi:MAG TPA: SDR family oxidoreductase [Pseudomonadales bacterium]|nr:SDR family oxidoreductase [Pseudomonadales bacterium]
MSKTILITGSSSGIGRKAAFLFQQAGWNVAATMRSPQKETELNQLENVICPALDVLDENSIQQAVTATVQRFGTIDVVLNNAGYGLIGAFETFSQEQIQRQFTTNVFGLMAVTRAVLPLMREKRSGTIINVASFAGRSIFPVYSVYHASKWAVEGYSESLQYELNRYGIRVKIIEPGIVKTEFWGRSTDRENVAGINAYADYSQPVLDLIDKAAGIIATQPEDVAHAIWQAATDSSDKLRYVVGLDAKITLAARRLLNERSYRALMNLTFNARSIAWFNSLAGRLKSS